jgi:hypothetical protein
MVGEALAAKMDKASTDKADEAMTAKTDEADECVAPAEAERAAAETILMSLWPKNQPRVMTRGERFIPSPRMSPQDHTGRW